MTTSAQLIRRPARRRLTRLLALAATISMTAVLAACSGGDGGSDASYGPSAAGGSSEVAPAEDRAVSDPGSAGAESAGSAGGRGDTSATGAPGAPVGVVRHAISTGTVSLRSDDVREARRDVQRVIDAQGGAVTEEETESDEVGEALYARLVLRVPAGRFGDTMAALEGVADPRASNRTSEDVSTQVIDTDVRVRAQEASLERVEQLLARARSLKDIIWIESQLARRQSDLDSLKQQQAWLADQTRDSTIVVDIDRTPREGPEEKTGSGFLAGFSGGMGALAAMAAALATVAGALLPFLVATVVLGLPLSLLVRRSVRRRRRSATPESAA